ncbi:hypothetical protein J4Q44_G00018300 [Coregonus suidteri]|uniref:Uncharacterized protein n=1 Tax=Coregonus suidteri TaxID=861788 RepID=A0AAN8ML98_9TELE
MAARRPRTCRQDGSIYILNVTWNDTGTYRCSFNRILTFRSYEFQTNATKIVHLNVVPRLTMGLASILSEVMMYVTTHWAAGMAGGGDDLLLTGKISAQGEESIEREREDKQPRRGEEHSIKEDVKDHGGTHNIH